MNDTATLQKTVFTAPAAEPTVSAEPTPARPPLITKAIAAAMVLLIAIATLMLVFGGLAPTATDSDLCPTTVCSTVA